jgi:glycosyltransferase involved in cell wall biosynthesis
MRAFKQAFPHNGPQLVLIGPNVNLSKGDGSWVCAEVYKVIRSLGLENRVKTLGTIPQEDLICLMSGAQALVFPSLYEGFGLPPVEAMAVGTPVICSNTSSLPEIVGDCGILLDPMNIKEWANAMKRVLNNREDYQTIIDRARVKSQSYSFDTMAKTLANVYATEFGINFH